MDSLPVDDYTGLQYAYDSFNSKLFDGELPHVMITLQRKKNSFGYLHAGRFKNHQEEIIDELAMNPTHLHERDDRYNLSTLVHEMCHVWQEHFGKPSKKGYHDKKWATKMKDVGLFPSTTGEPGGKETGQKCSHYIVDGDLFDTHCATLLEDNFKINWCSPELPAAIKKKKDKVKYTCSLCGAKAWAKPEMELICGNCTVEDSKGIYTIEKMYPDGE